MLYGIPMKKTNVEILADAGWDALLFFHVYMGWRRLSLCLVSGDVTILLMLCFLGNLRIPLIFDQPSKLRGLCDVPWIVLRTD